jgi:hypothetical protein
MSRLYKLLLVLAGIASGTILFTVAFTVQLNPYWLNTVLILIGFGLMAGSVTYLFIKAINRIIR